MGSKYLSKLVSKFPEYDFGYSDYINMRTNIRVICPIHGEFLKKPSLMLYNNQGCQKCGLERRSLKLYNNIDELIVRFNNVHNNKYDYSESIYERNNKVIKIICPIHGEFYQRPDNHLNSGCKECGLISMARNKTYNLIDFIRISNEVHNNKYDYSESVYKDSVSEVQIICRIHGKFTQIASYHMNGSGCPICNTSKGERIISSYLSDNNILYFTQYVFKDCKYIDVLKFDFYLPEYNLCIEYDGRQHFMPICAWGGEKGFMDTQKRDEVKNKYCIENGIELLRISYKERDKISELIRARLLNRTTSSIR